MMGINFFASRTLMQEGKGKQGMDGMRGVTAEIVGVEETLLDSRAKEAAQM